MTSKNFWWCVGGYVAGIFAGSIVTANVAAGSLQKSLGIFGELVSPVDVLSRLCPPAISLCAVLGLIGFAILASMRGGVYPSR